MLAQTRLPLAFTALLALSILACGFSEKAEAQDLMATVDAVDPPTKPVLVELFTSQGCSSCPPADQVLEALAAEAKDGGSAVVALSYHVDYWNRLGWRDPYSQAAFSDRQRVYSQHINDRGVYTPQLVINGRSGHIGSRQREVQAAIATAEPLSIQIETSVRPSEQTGSIDIDYQLSAFPERANLQLALVSTQVDNDVPRGENRGRHLSHTNVVRELTTIEAEGPTGTYTYNLPDDVQDDGELAVVLFVQDARTMAIQGTSALQAVIW